MKLANFVWNYSNVRTMKNPWGNFHLLFSAIVACFLATNVLFNTQNYAYAKETQTQTADNKPIVEVTLKLEGKTISGKPKVASAEKTSGALYEKSGVPIELKKTGTNTWSCSVLEGRQYVIGWIAKKGWFEKNNKMFGYCSEPFVAAKELEVTFSPGMPAKFEYNLSNPPKDVHIFPANVTLYIKTINKGKTSFLSWGGNKKLNKPGVVTIDGLASGTYQIHALTSDWIKDARSRTPFLFDKRQIEIQPGIVNRFEPIYPEIDTTVEKGDITISGTLYSAKKTPLANRVVQLTPYNDNGIIQNLFYPASTTDPNGRFEFVGVRPNVPIGLNSNDAAAFLAGESVQPGSSIYVDLVLGLNTLNLTTGASIPDIIIDWKKGGTSKLSDLVGKTVVVDLWATWCSPCKKALPEINSLAAQWSKNDAVVFIALSNDSNRTIWEEMVDKSNWNALRHGWLDKKKNSFVFKKPIPYSFIIDKNGVLCAEGNGLDIRSELEKIAKDN